MHETKIPDGAKKPQDKKPPKVAETEDFRVELHGREWVVSRDALDDFELLDDISELDKGNVTKMTSIAHRLLGDQWSDVMEVLRDKDTNRVSVEAGAEFVGDLLTALNPNS